MNLSGWLIIPIQALLSGCALLMAQWVHLPWPAMIGVVVLGTSSMVAAAVPAKPRKWVFTGNVAIVGVSTLVILTSLFAAAPYSLSVFDEYYAVLAGLLGAVLLLNGFRPATDPIKTRWLILAMVWAFLGSFLWLGASYLKNVQWEFYAGLLAPLGLLILSKFWFRMSAFTILFVNTLILLAICLPVVDFFYRPHYRFVGPPDLRQRPYSYETAKRDPAAFAAWQIWSGQQWGTAVKDSFIPDPARILPYRLKPNYRAVLFESEVSINSRGFRGREISEQKGNAYRVVALGESSTFGTTLSADEKPWPELLEQLVRERLNPGRPVEVINAGLPGLTLGDNLHRFAADILPLKPDMIISYHGYNGFRLLSEALPRVYGDTPPRFHPRPLKLLADCEYSLKMLRFRRDLVSNLIRHPPSFSHPLESKYAQVYQELIQAAKTNGIRLVLANYSMAVNEQSDPAVIEFYRASAFPAVRWQIRANAAHSIIVQQMAEHEQGVCWVDTHPHLDGAHQKFIDLMHFNHDGDQQLAETMFEGIEKVLRLDLGLPNSAQANNTNQTRSHEPQL